MSRRQKLQEDFESLKNKYQDDSIITELTLSDDCESIYFTFNEDAYEIQVSEYPDFCQLFEPGQDDPLVHTGTLEEVISGIVTGEAGEVNFEYEGLRTSEGINYYDEESMENRYKSNEQLMSDVDNFINIFGEDKISFRSMPVLEEVEIELSIPPRDVLSATIAQGWGVDINLPIVIKIPVSDLHYMESSKPPKIEVFQKNGDKKLKFGLKAQLEGLLDTFVMKWWPSRSGIKIGMKKAENNKLSTSTKNLKPPLPSKLPQRHTEKKQNFFETVTSSVTNLFFKEKKQGDTKQQITENSTALKIEKEIIDKDIVNHPEKLLKPDSDQPTHPTPLVEEWEPKKAKIPKVDELFKDPKNSLRSQSDEEKLYVNPDYGWLVMVMAYVRRRISTLNDYCVICDRPHVFATGNMLKPAVCSRELCCWSFQQLGVGSEAADDIATEAEVIDLLVCMATVAVKNTSRRELIFDPFPLVFDLENKNKKVLDPENKDFALVESLLSKMPSVEKMTQASDFVSMKESLDRASPFCFPLLQWIISSNRSHIVQLAEGRHIKSMVTKHQYLLLSAPPEKEEIFRNLKKQHNSIFAFHGSGIENWHSILRKGLINASGTKYQLNGAAYGSGIYLSPFASTSFGYSRMSNYGNQNSTPTGGNRFLSSDSVNCIAICEVINKDIRKNGGIWVQPSTDCVVTRFFFVYRCGDAGTAINCNTEDVNFNKEIQTAIDYYQGLSKEQ